LLKLVGAKAVWHRPVQARTDARQRACTDPRQVNRTDRNGDRTDRRRQARTHDGCDLRDL